MTGLNIQIEWEIRLCKVGKKFGYFHGWERQFNWISSPPSFYGLGGTWAGGVCKSSDQMIGIVEFSDGVRRVDSSEILFCDEENQMLLEMEKMRKSHD